MTASAVGGEEQQTKGDWLDEQFGPSIARLSLDPLQQDYLRARWLDQVRWMEGRAVTCQRRYYALRVLSIAGGVLISALAGVGVSADAWPWSRGVLLVLGIVVALATAIEGFFRYGERWRHYRRNAEALKGEAWSFLQLSGRYAGVQDHAAAFPDFASNIEQVLSEDVVTFLSQVTATKDEQRPTQ